MTDDPKPATDGWGKEQINPLNMFELAGKWTDAIKVIGAGNGAGAIAAGAALNLFSQRSEVLLWVKFGGVTFFVGVFAFALAFFSIHSSFFFYDEMLHATRNKDIDQINRYASASTTAMNAANWFSYLGIATFFIGCLAGIIALIKF
jgi:hypothetical protein